MNTPPLLIGAALLFWGMHTGFLLPAIILAIILEGSRLTSRQWDLSTNDLYRIWDLCAVLLLASGVYCYASEKPSVPLTVLQWLPMIFLPILAAQAFGSKNRMELSVFFLLLRRKKNRKDVRSTITVNLTYPYLAVCIAAAAASNWRTLWFYVGCCALTAWALWVNRSHRFSVHTWTGFLLLAMMAGYGGSLGLNHLQKVLEQRFVDFYARHFLNLTDPLKTYTAIGEVGALKLSDEIVLRVEKEDSWSGPILLAQSSYNTYRGSSWFAVKATLDPVPSIDGGNTWTFQNGKIGEGKMIVSAWLKGGKGVLALPNNSFQVERLPVVQVLKNRLGAVKVEKGPGLIIYTVRTDAATSINAPPDETDLLVPQKEDPVITRLAMELQLYSKSPEEVAKLVKIFFTKNFKYSLQLERGSSRATPLGDFLINTRKGHCEYFATATTLLLRKAGIPARYTIGFMAHEFSRREGKILVRGRDAHAWTLVHMGGKWRPFDTTPPAWVQEDKQNASSLEPLADFFSYLSFLFSRWRWSEEESPIKKYVVYFLIPLILILAWRIYSQTKITAGKVSEEAKEKSEIRSPGMESEFYRIEKKLKEHGLGRYSWETHCQWMRRVEAADIPHLSAKPLWPILAVHYRHRFDPKGISRKEEADLKSQVKLWMESCPE